MDFETTVVCCQLIENFLEGQMARLIAIQKEAVTLVVELSVGEALGVLQ